MHVISNKEPIYDADSYDVILIGISTHNKLMGNFQKKMAIKFPIIEKVDDSTAYGDIKKLGKNITIHDNIPIVCLMYVCTYPTKNTYLDYNALETCLQKANKEFKGKKVMTTIIGSTKFDGKGDKEKCLKIIEENTKDLDLYVYDYEQISISEEINRQNNYFANLRKQYKGNKEMLDKLTELSKQMRKKTYLPEKKSNKDKNNNILNF